MRSYKNCWICYAIWIPLFILGALWLYAVGMWIWEFLPYALALVWATMR